MSDDRPGPLRRFMDWWRSLWSYENNRTFYDELDHYYREQR